MKVNTIVYLKKTYIILNFSVINRILKYRNLTFLAIYFYKINIFPLSLAHQMQNFINFHAIMGKKISTCYYKNEDTLGIAKTSEEIISTGSVY